MSATGDELFSKLTDIVRELKDAKDASDRRIDATEDTLKDVKDTLHESARYDKATAESFKKLLEATKEHSKLLKDLKPGGLSGTDKDKEARGGLFGQGIVTKRNVLTAGLAYEGIRTVQNRGLTQKYGPLAALLLGGGTYAAQGLGAAASQLLGYAGYGAAGAAGLYGAYRGAKAFGPGLIKGALKGAAAMPGTAGRAVGSVVGGGKAGARAAASTAAARATGFTGTKKIGGIDYKLKNGKITHIHGGRGAGDFVSIKNKKAFAKATAAATSKATPGAMALGGVGGAKAIPVLGWLLTAGLTVTEAFDVLSNPELVQEFEEEFEKAGLLGKTGSALMNPVKAASMAAGKLTESIMGYETKAEEDKKFMKFRTRPTTRTEVDPFSATTQTFAPSKSELKEFEEYEQYHKRRNKLIDDILTLDDGYHFLWGVNGLPKNPGGTNVVRHFTRTELQRFNESQLIRIKSHLIKYSTTKKAVDRRDKDKKIEEARIKATVDSYRYRSTMDKRGSFTPPMATHTSLLKREIQEGRLDALVDAEIITDQNFKYLKPETQKYLKERYGTKRFTIPKLTESERIMQQQDSANFNRIQQEKTTKVQEEISKNLGLAAEAFHKLVDKVEKDPSVLNQNPNIIIDTRDTGTTPLPEMDNNNFKDTALPLQGTNR